MRKLFYLIAFAILAAGCGKNEGGENGAGNGNGNGSESATVTQKANIGTASTANASLLYYDGKLQLLAQNGEWWQYDIEKDKWEEQLPLPSVLSGTGFGFIFDGDMYYCIAIVNSSSSELYKYVSSTQEWEIFHEFIFYPSYIQFIFEQKIYFDNGYIFEPVTKEIKQYSSASAYKIDGTYNGRGYGIFNENLYEYNPTTDRWVVKRSVNLDAHPYSYKDYFRGFFYNGCVYYFSSNQKTVARIDIETNEMFLGPIVLPTKEMIHPYTPMLFLGKTIYMVYGIKTYVIEFK